MSEEADTWMVRRDDRTRHGAHKYRATGKRRIVAESMKTDEGHLVDGLYHYDIVEADGTFVGAYEIVHHGCYWSLRRLIPSELFGNSEPEPYHNEYKEVLVGMLHDWVNGGPQP